MSLHDFMMIYFTLHIDLQLQQYNPLVEAIARSVDSHVNSCKFNIDQFMILWYSIWVISGVASVNLSRTLHFSNMIII